MAAFRALIVLGVCLFFSYSTSAQQCDQAIEDFHGCLRDSMKKGGQGRGQGQQGQRPNFEELKKKSDECFTSNGCDAPQFGGKGGPSGPQGSQSGQAGGRGQGSRGGQGGQGGQGGRAGRVGGQGGQGGNDDRRKCFQSVGNKTKDYMLQCMRKSDPSFSFPTKGGPGGAGGRGGFGGDHDGARGGFGGGDHHEGGAHGGFGQGGEQFLLQACKNNQGNADKAKTCLTGLMQSHQSGQGQEQMRQVFDDHCKAKTECEKKLGACKDTMEKRRQAMCTCGQEVNSKRQEFLQQEPLCANVQANSSGNKRPGQGKQRDCNQKPQDPCAQGFDAVMKQAQSHH